MQFKKIIQTGLCSFILAMFLAAPSWAVDVDVHFNVNGYDGFWTIDGVGGALGDKTFTLSSGVNQILTVGGLDNYVFNVDASGNISFLTTPISDSFTVDNSTDPSTINFITKEISFNPVGFLGGYRPDGKFNPSPSFVGPQTKKFVAGVNGYRIRIESNFKFFNVDAIGNVRLVNFVGGSFVPDDDNNTDSLTATGNTITFKNTDVTIDPVQYFSGYRFQGNRAGVEIITVVPDNSK